MKNNCTGELKSNKIRWDSSQENWMFCVVPGKCGPMELKAINWLVFSLFLKSHGITPATYRETGKKTNKQTALRLPSAPILSLVIF